MLERKKFIKVIKNGLQSNTVAIQKSAMAICLSLAPESSFCSEAHHSGILAPLFPYLSHDDEALQLSALLILANFSAFSSANRIAICNFPHEGILYLAKQLLY